jgi:glutathione S-transferase
MVLDRFCYSKGQGKHFVDNVAVLPVPKFLLPLVRGRIKKLIKTSSDAQGIGRHSEEEVMKIAIDDIKSFSNYLGDKAYLMGSKPTEVDCSLFAQMAQIIYATPDGNQLKKAIEEDYRNIMEFVLRVKEKYWPDWEECLHKDEKK